MLKNFKRKPLLVGAICLASTMAVTGSTYAFSLVEGFNYQLPGLNYNALVSRANQQLRQVLNNSISEYFGPELAPVMRQSVDQALGVLGYPSPNVVTQEIDQELGSLPQPDITQPVPGSTTSAVTRQVNRGLLDQQIESVLSQQAQQVTQQKSQVTTSAVTASNELAIDAQAALSTQEASG